MTTPPMLDEVRLVLIAAAASATSPEEVLATTDVAALTRVAAEIEACEDVLEVAATALVGIAKERPFGADSGAVAWLACAVAAPVEAARLAAVRADAVDLVERASSGRASPQHVREHLASRRWRCRSCRRTSDDTPWRPVISNPHTGAMIVLTDVAPILLVPEGDSYLAAEAAFVAGDLVGDWRGLVERASIRGTVPRGAVALDEGASMIDWSRLDGVLELDCAVV